MDRGDVHRAVLEDLLAAPGSEAGWSTFLNRIADALGGWSANFIAHDFSSPDTQIAITGRTDPEAVAMYTTHWHSFDPWAASPLTPRSTAGLVLHGEELISRTDLRQTAFFNEFGRLYGIVGLAGFIEVSPQALSCISLITPPERTPFSTTDAEFLHSLLPSIRRAIDLHRRLSGAELMSLCSAAILDRLPQGVLLLSRRGTVRSTNRAANEILRARDGLLLDRGELRGATPTATNQLRDAVSAAITRNPARRDNVVLSLPRPSLRRPYSITIAPLPSSQRMLMSPGEAVVVMFVADPDKSTLVDPETVAHVLGLTPTEARLACYLVAGLTLEEAASHLGVRIATVRWRLKIIFQKTDTHRQSDLVRLVLTAAGPGTGK
jgi:DNA-binding CsgD family transcriptional regulator